jgi:hypothetical protein
MLVPLPTLTVPVARKTTIPVKYPAVPAGVVVKPSQADAVRESVPSKVTAV